jgi:hypothetical protein
MSWTIAPVGRGSNLIYSQAGMPSLDLRFAETKSLNDFISSTNLITFTRASNATFFDSNGLIQTATTDVPRFDHNPATGESLGLLVEEQRVNLLLNSETLATQSATVAAAAHTLSFYGTGSVVLSGAHSATVNGTGAYPTRTTLTFTPSAGSLTLTVTGTVQYANLEAGAFATSWIPTTGSTATRSADVASITGANFSGWYRQDEGTMFVSGDFVKAGPSTFSRMVGLAGANTGIDEISVYTRIGIGGGDGAIFGAVTVNSSLEGDLSAPTGFPDFSGGYRSAIAYKANDFGLSSNGLAPTVDTSGTLPTITQLVIMGIVRFQRRHNGHIRRITYWPRRLANTTLQTVTQV